MNVGHAEEIQFGRVTMNTEMAAKVGESSNLGVTECLAKTVQTLQKRIRSDHPRRSIPSALRRVLYLQGQLQGETT